MDKITPKHDTGPRSTGGGTLLTSSLSTFSSSVECSIREAKSLTDRAAAAAAAPTGASTDNRCPKKKKNSSFDTSEIVRHGETATEFLTLQQDRAARIEQSLLAVADALLSYPPDDDGTSAASLAELSKLCSVVYESNAFELASLEDDMVHRLGYGGTEARLAAIDALEAGQAAAEAASAAAAGDDDSRTAGHSIEKESLVDVQDYDSEGDDGNTSLREEEVRATSITTNSSALSSSSSTAATGSSNIARAPLEYLSQNVDNAGDVSSKDVNMSTSNVGVSGLGQLQPIGEAEGETDTSTNGSPKNAAEDQQGAARSDSDVDDGGNDFLSSSPSSPSSPGRAIGAPSSSPFVPSAPVTPATPSLASLNVSQCTATASTLGESVMFEQPCVPLTPRSPSSSSTARSTGSASPSSSSSCYRREFGQSPLSITSAQREEVSKAAGEDVAVGTSKVPRSEGRKDGFAKELEVQYEGSLSSAGTAESDGDEEKKQEESSRSIHHHEDAVDVVDRFDDGDSHTFDGSDNSGSDEHNDDATDVTEGSHTYTIENEPMFEETIVNDGCSLATVSTIIAERKLAQLMAAVESDAAATADEDMVPDDDRRAVDLGSADFDNEQSSDDDESTSSTSSLDRLLESDSNQGKPVQEDGTEQVEGGPRRTPILDRYKVQAVGGQLKVSPKEAAERFQPASNKSPKVSPFGRYESAENNDGDTETGIDDDVVESRESLSNRLQQQQHSSYGSSFRPRKVYPKTPISKFPVPLEEDEDMESDMSTEPDLKLAASASSESINHEIPKGTACKGNRTNESETEQSDSMMQRLSAGGRVPFSPQATIGSNVCTPTNVAPDSAPIELHEEGKQRQEGMEVAKVDVNTSKKCTPSPSSASCRTPLAAAWIERNMPEDKERLLAILSPTGTSSMAPSSAGLRRSSSPNRSSTQRPTESRSDARRKSRHSIKDVVRHLTTEEYVKAPRIVKSQVAFDEVGAAVTALNTWLLAHGHIDEGESNVVELSEDQAYCLLGDMFNRRKAKTICMSLCHWRRLLMQGDRDGLKFVVCSSPRPGSSTSM